MKNSSNRLVMIALLGAVVASVFVFTSSAMAVGKGGTSTSSPSNTVSPPPAAPPSSGSTTASAANPS